MRSPRAGSALNEAVKVTKRRAHLRRSANRSQKYGLSSYANSEAAAAAICIHSLRRRSAIVLENAWQVERGSGTILQSAMPFASPVSPSLSQRYEDDTP